MELTEAKKYIKLMEALEDQRRPWDTRNKDITSFQMPGRGKYQDVNPEANAGNEDLYDDIINETCALASRITVAGMIWGLSSPAGEWFRIGIEDKDLQKYGPVKEHLRFIQKGLRTTLHRSNFYSVLYPIYEEEVGFGTACALGLEDDETIVRFQLVPTGQYALAGNARGMVDTMGRRFQMTAQQMMENFGKDNVGKAIREGYKKDPYQWFEVVHFLEPNKNADNRMIDNKNMLYSSVYIDPTGESRLLGKSGFPENPLFAPRWAVNGEDVYGHGIGGLMLGSSMQLQAMEKDSLAALMKTIDPPTVGPPEYSDNLDVSAGAFNPAPPGARTDTIKALYQIDFNVRGVEEKIRAVEARISRGYFNDLFLFIMNNPNATATEILERKAEKVILLGPVVTRQEDELFDLAIKRTYGILTRVDFFPPPPPELEDHTLEIEYVSQLAIAQKIAGAEGIYNYLAFVGQATSLDRAAADKLNADEAVDEMAEILGVPPKINNDANAVARIREGRAEAEAKQQEAAEVMSTIQGAEQLSRTDTSGKNALTDLTAGE